MQKTIKVTIKEASIKLASLSAPHKSDSPKLDTQVLLCNVLDKPMSYLLTWPDKELSIDEQSAFSHLLQRRLNGEPIAYIVGQKEFWSLPFFVSPSTLIPRPDTETLVDLVLANHGEKNLNLLDLGTGTGAIALALASEQPQWKIDAIDFNSDAVKLAKKNAQHLELTQVNIYQSDWFSNVEAGNKLDVIVSNPPYIDKNDRHLAQGDVRFEPLSALVADNKGLADIEHIAVTAKGYLAVGGHIYFEHGYDQGVAVRALLSGIGYQDCQTVQDLAGNDRITWAKLTNT